MMNMHKIEIYVLFVKKISLSRVPFTKEIKARGGRDGHCFLEGFIEAALKTLNNVS